MEVVYFLGLTATASKHTYLGYALHGTHKPQQPARSEARVKRQASHRKSVASRGSRERADRAAVFCIDMARVCICMYVTMESETITGLAEFGVEMKPLSDAKGKRRKQSKVRISDAMRKARDCDKADSSSSETVS